MVIHPRYITVDNIIHGNVYLWHYHINIRCFLPIYNICSRLPVRAICKFVILVSKKNRMESQAEENAHFFQVKVLEIYKNF